MEAVQFLKNPRFCLATFLPFLAFLVIFSGLQVFHNDILWMKIFWMQWPRVSPREALIIFFNLQESVKNFFLNGKRFLQGLSKN